MQALSIQAVCDRTSLKKSYIYQLAADPKAAFPQPAKLGKRSVWNADEIDTWLQRQFESRGKEAAHGKAA